MTQHVTLYTNPMSRGRIVRWMLEEIGQPYNGAYRRAKTMDDEAAKPTLA